MSEGPAVPDASSGAGSVPVTTDASEPGPESDEAVVPSAPASPALAGSYVITLAGSAGMIVLTLFTGVVSARLLSPDGRGAVGAIAGWVIVVTILGSLGFREGMGWIESRTASLAPQVLTISVVSIFVTSAVAVAVAELLIPFGFAAQSDEVVRYARIFMVWVLPYSACYAFTSLFGARHRFAAVTAMRVGQPLMYAIGLAILWIVGIADVKTVLIVQVVSFVLPALLAFATLYRQSGMGRFDWQIAKTGAAFGLKAFGSTLGLLANSRLDLMILPALVISSEIGLYVVAVSAASMIVGLFGSLRLVVFPAVARLGGQEAIAVTQRATRVVFAAALVTAIILGVLAEFLIRLLYGADFSGAVTPLRMLLPGIVCWAAAQIITGGLKGVGRPASASTAQFCGVGVTLVGLAVLLGPYGIRGAAITSSVSYFTVLAVGLVLFSRATDTRIRDTFDLSALVVDLRWAFQRLQRVLRRG